MLNCFTAATESPPPTSENVPFFVLADMASPKAIVPCEKCENSKTPNGPFHSMVLLCNTTSRKAARFLDQHPSLPNRLGFGRLERFVDSPHLKTGLLRPHLLVNGFERLSLLRLPRIERANSCLSSSQMEFPICPPIALAKVNDIPPPIIRWSTLSNMFSIIVILEDTFAPKHCQHGLFAR